MFVQNIASASLSRDRRIKMEQKQKTLDKAKKKGKTFSNLKQNNGFLVSTLTRYPCIQKAINGFVF